MGSLAVPRPSDPSISALSASLHGHAILAPETRHCINMYREGGAGVPCGKPASTVNATNMVSVLWGP
jgi:hypothetical protein